MFGGVEMNTQYKKILRTARTLFVVVFMLFTSAALVSGQRKNSKAPGRTTQQKSVQQLPQPAVTTVMAQPSLPEIVRRIKPSVVALIVFDKDGKHIGQGSAFFIAPQRIVTNYHVIKGGNTGEIHTNEGFAYSVNRVLSYDPSADLAILDVELPSGVQFKPLTLARGEVQEGENIVVIGNPQGLQGTVSQGIVSAMRQFADGSSTVQITAPISQGSSGSPVVNMRGEVVGVAVGTKSDGQNLNFAVPSSSLAAISERAERSSKIARIYEDGLRLYRGGNYKRALEMFAQTIKESPSYADAWMEIGRTHYALGDYAAASAAFIETARLEPNNAAALYNAGLAYAENNRDADAVACFRRALSLQPNNADAYFEAGNAFYRLSDFRSAIDSYKQAINLRPDNASAHYNLGLAFVAQGERKSARKQKDKLQQLGAAELAGKLLQNIPR
jgi:S1-C subfamily serine protease/cytochrome c-type biogenesis protein CcmH/NrfG